MIKLCLEMIQMPMQINFWEWEEHSGTVLIIQKELSKKHRQTFYNCSADESLKAPSQSLHITINKPRLAGHTILGFLPIHEMQLNHIIEQDETISTERNREALNGFTQR
ncbi:hypothetical protein QQ045_017581 [Rhodiola kirilowii]